MKVIHAYDTHLYYLTVSYLLGRNVQILVVDDDPSASNIHPHLRFGSKDFKTDS